MTCPCYNKWLLIRIGIDRYSVKCVTHQFCISSNVAYNKYPIGTVYAVVVVIDISLLKDGDIFDHMCVVSCDLRPM